MEPGQAHTRDTQQGQPRTRIRESLKAAPPPVASHDSRPSQTPTTDQESTMDYYCHDCDATFNAPTDTDTASCPGCGEMAVQQPAPTKA